MVRRVGASGGGRTYRRQRPVNFYGVIALIVVLGTLSIIWARYEYQHPTGAAAATPPAVGTTWYSGLGITACGVAQPELAPQPGSVSGFTAQANSLIRVSPANKTFAGTNATLDKFVSGYKGLVVTASELALPGKNGAADPATTWKTGEKCPAGTKDAGQTGEVQIAVWPNVISTKPTLTTSSSSVKFAPRQLITFYFGPKGVTPPKPSTTTIAALLQASATAGTTTTTQTIKVTPTTAATTTTSASTTTTSKG
jgi:hypothetical protein